MPIVSRGFRGRRRDDAPRDRVPPGQYITDDFPVLSAGPTPHTPLDQWDFTIVGEVDERRRWTWDELRALPSETFTVDIHCVTKWTKLDTVWEGVPVDTLLADVGTAADYAVAFCDGGYTTNLPLADLTGGKAWIAFGYDGDPLDPEHGGPALLVAGGSGVVPLMAIVRHRVSVGSGVGATLLFSSRSWDDVIYRDELDRVNGNGL